jgi:hypothetical protein
MASSYRFAAERVTGDGAPLTSVVDSAMAAPPASEREDLSDPRLSELVERLQQSTGMPPSVAQRVVAEVFDLLDEPTETFVRRRHRELQHGGLRNDEISARIAAELHRRPVRAPELSARQIRRIIYG